MNQRLTSFLGPNRPSRDSFQSLLKDLSTITRNTIVPQVPNTPGWTQDTEPTPLQKTILEKIAAIKIA